MFYSGKWFVWFVVPTAQVKVKVKWQIILLKVKVKWQIVLKVKGFSAMMPIVQQIKIKHFGPFNLKIVPCKATSRLTV